MQIKIQSTVEPTVKLSLEEWLAKFKVGILAPKPIEGRERAKRMMEEYNFSNISKSLKS
jgi:hypothetical protein